MAPGILYVTIQPKSSLPLPDYEDWYNNEHGPNRLRPVLLHQWLPLSCPTSTKRSEGPPVQTQREIDIRPHLDIDRRSFELTQEWSLPDYKPLERIGGEDGGAIMFSATYKLKPGKTISEIQSWYAESTSTSSARFPGGDARAPSSLPPSTTNTMPPRRSSLACTNSTPENGLSGPAGKAPSETPRAQRLSNEVLSAFVPRLWTHHCTLGPAPRHLSTVAKWDSPATRTRTMPAASGTPYNAVQSYITTPDGAILPYKLEGSSSAAAPVVLCINSILTHPSIWDEFATKLPAA
ncbi:hypothetical protein MRB53_041442 [Persea americana]|nr:hypothetical protein MRB53_041442 [Persea americana]